MAGTLLLQASWIAPSAAVVVLAPAQAPSVIAGWNRKMNRPARRPTTRGMQVTNTPAASRLSPDDFRPETKLGPAVMPTTAMKAVSPRLLSTHSAGAGMRPNVRLTDRSQPQTSPPRRAPPLVLRLRGM